MKGVSPRFCKSPNHGQKGNTKGEKRGGGRAESTTISLNKTEASTWERETSNPVTVI